MSFQVTSHNSKDDLVTRRKEKYGNHQSEKDVIIDQKSVEYIKKLKELNKVL
jgi:hypothetical protein